MIVRALQGDTLDAICHRHLGRTQDAVEAALALNPGLADLGPVLPMGTAVELPELPAPPANNTVNLWD